MKKGYEWEKTVCNLRGRQVCCSLYSDRYPWIYNSVRQSGLFCRRSELIYKSVSELLLFLTCCWSDMLCWFIWGRINGVSAVTWWDLIWLSHFTLWKCEQRWIKMWGRTTERVQLINNILFVSFFKVILRSLKLCANFHLSLDKTKKQNESQKHFQYWLRYFFLVLLKSLKMIRSCSNLSFGIGLSQ